jgi:hypothetical protein
MRARTFAAVCCAAAAAASTPCFAITAKDVTEKMSEKERFGYLTGLVDMLSYQSLLAGDRKRAECVSSAFYKTDGTQKQIVDALYSLPDKAPEGIVILVINRACGK